MANIFSQYKFEKLDVWQESLNFSEKCYEICKEFPAFERNGLSDQLRRASTSIMLNIAEGSGADSDKDFLKFLMIARKSLYETVALLKFIERVYPKIDLTNAYPQAETTGKLLNAFIKKLKANG